MKASAKGYDVVKTACPRNCYTTCGLLVHVKDGRAIKVQGDPDHPITKGHICTKMHTAIQRTYSPDRIKYPLKRVGEKGEGKFLRISWDEAWDILVNRLTEIKERYGSEALMEYKYSGSHELVGKEIAHRFFNLFGSTELVGTICNANGIAGHEYTFGDRLCQDPHVWSEAAECVIIWGRRVEATNIHLARFVLRVKERGGKLIVVDPFVGNIASKADLHVRPKPGNDAALALGMMHHMVKEGLYDRDFVDNYTHGFQDLLWEIEKMPVSKAAEIVEVPEDEIKKAAEWYAIYKSMLICGYAPQRYSNGFQTQRAIACLSAISGHIGKPGEHYEFNSGYFGGMARPAKIAKPEEANISQRRRVVIGLANVGILEAKDPPIKAMICWRGNFLTQQPNTNLSLKALKSLEFLAVFEQFLTDDTDYADLVLPACTFVEQYGFKNPVWHPYLQIQVPAIEPVYESMPDIDFWCELGRRMGFEHYFPKEWTAKDWIRLFINEEIDIEEMMHPNGPVKTPEKFYPEVPYQDLKFKTPTGKIELYSTKLEKLAKDKKDPEPVPVFKEVEDSPGTGSTKYSLNLLTFRSKKTIHSQYRNLPWIKELIGSPKVFVHPQDAAIRGVKDGDLIRIFNDYGEATSRAKITKRVKLGMLITADGYWIKMGGNVNFVIGSAQGGPREVGNGILQAEDPPFNIGEDGCSPGYCGAYVEIEHVKAEEADLHPELVKAKEA